MLLSCDTRLIIIVMHFVIAGRGYRRAKTTNNRLSLVHCAVLSSEEELVTSLCEWFQTQHDKPLSSETFSYNTYFKISRRTDFKVIKSNNN